MSGLEGRVAVVTGGASGIGRACAVRFAAEGAAVVVADLDERGGAETVGLVEAGRARFIRTDVTSEADCEALADGAVSAFGRLDVVVAAAGIDQGRTDGRPAPREQRFMLEAPLEHWQQVLAVNLTGVMLTTRAAARRMVAAGNGGAIVNLASMRATAPAPALGPYCVSKAGVAMLTKVLALELARHGIRVNAIGPGVVDTPMSRAAIDVSPEILARLEQSAPLGRIGQPEDIANAALFLASDESSYVTGELLFVDGGWFTG